MEDLEVREIEIDKFDYISLKNTKEILETLTLKDERFKIPSYILHELVLKYERADIKEIIKL